MHPEELPNLDRSLESLESRLRALPPPAVPAGLEARLLAAIPACLPAPRRRWVARVGAAALAAAGLLAVLAWLGRDGNNVVIGPPSSHPTAKITPRPPEDADGIAILLQALRDLDEADPPTFTWPLPPTPPLTLAPSIPADLLD
jgi:hypothetical protein